MKGTSNATTTVATARSKTSNRKLGDARRSSQSIVQDGDSAIIVRSLSKPRQKSLTTSGDADLDALRRSHGGGLPRPLTRPNEEVRSNPSIFTESFIAANSFSILGIASMWIINPHAGIIALTGYALGVAACIGR